MKKYFSILSLVLMAMCCNVVFTSCGDDDDDEKVVVEKRNDLVGTWERIADVDCREIIIFYADGKYLQKDQNLEKKSSVKYYDEDLTYYQTKGYYSVSNGTLSLEQTHEWDHKWEVMDWKECPEKGSVSYEVVDGNTLNLTGPNPETGKVETVPYTRVK
jgi:hypothetical protein